MPRTALMDSAAILALLDSRDADHESARRELGRLEAEGSSIFITNFVRAEAYTLIGARLSWDNARAWLRELDLPMEFVTTRDEERAKTILLQYQDKSFSFVDATSFAVMERLGIRSVFTFDQHFQQFGYDKIPPHRHRSA